MVYRGVQLSLEREVAIKILPPGIDATDPGFGLRFENESRAMARLKHPSIVSVIDAGETANGLRYFAMDYIDGGDLGQLLERCGSLPLEEVFPIMAEICEALQFAHENGIVHRDIKPSNILIDRENHIKVADFGLARVANSGVFPTLTHMVAGSPDYLAPEAQVPGAAPDHRADVFALGVMLYQTLAGRLPRGRFEPASAVVNGLDRRIDQVIDKALQADPDRRYQSVRSFLDALHDAASRSRLPLGRRAWLLSCLGAATSGLAWWFWQRGRGSSTTLVPVPPDHPKVSLLPKVDVKRDGLAGKWSLNADGELLVLKGSFSTTGGKGMPRAIIPYRPPEEYDYEVEFTPASMEDGELFLLFPAGRHPVAWRPSQCGDSPRFSGFGELDKLGISRQTEAVARLDAKPRYGARNTTRVEVRANSLRGFLNGRELVSWTGDFSRFSSNEFMTLPNPLALGIGVYRTDATIHRIDLTEISGRGHSFPAHNGAYPPGRWMPAYSTEAEAQAIGGNAAWEDGWLIPGKGAIALGARMESLGANWGARATYRWAEEPDAHAIIVLRKMNEERDGGRLTRELVFEVYRDRVVFRYVTSRNSVMESNPPLGPEKPLDLKPGQIVRIEACVIGNSLHGRVDDVRVEAGTQGQLNEGAFDIACYHLIFRDLAFINLDGLTEPEVRQSFGIS